MKSNVLVSSLAVTESNPTLTVYLASPGNYSVKYQLLHLKTIVRDYQLDANDDRLELNLHSGKTSLELIVRRRSIIYLLTLFFFNLIGV